MSLKDALFLVHSDRIPGARAQRTGRIAAMALIVALGVGVSQGTAAAESTSATVLYERGASALRAGDGDSASGFLEQATELEPDDWKIQALYARALLVKGDNVKAIEAFDRVEQLNPGAKDINYYRGIASYRLGRWADTLRYLGQVSAERDQSGRLHLYKGISYQELQDYPAAEAELAKAAELDPTLEGATAYRLGVMALQRKDVAEAEVYLRRVEASVPGSALARSAKAYLEQIDSGLYRPFALYARLGGGYDSNVSLQTGEFEGYSELASGVGSAEFGINGLVVDTEKLDVRVGATGYINFHGGEPAKTYDQILANGFALASYEINERARIGVGYNFEYVWADYKNFRLTNAVEGSFRFIPYKGFVTSLYYGYQRRDYLFDLPSNLDELNRDGGVQRAGIDQIWYTPDWTGWGQNYVTAGFRFRRENSKGTEYDSNGYAPQIGVGISLPWEMFWTNSFGYEWRNFSNPSCLELYPSTTLCDSTTPRAPGAQDRRDEILRVSTDLRIPIIETVFVDLRYAFWKRMSNVDFYSYERNLAQFMITYRY